jgi:NAD(P) transhydrogenase
MPILDAEISGQLAEAFVADGIRLVLGAGQCQVERHERRLRVRLPGGEELHPEKVLFAAGRTGNTEGLGLEEAGIETDARGRIVVDASYRTTLDGVYAAGDVVGPPGLASVSMDQGRRAASNAFGTPYARTALAAPPIGIYCLPEVGSVGLTEEAAAGAGEEYETGRASFTANTRARISGATEGMVKLVFRRADRRLLGAHVIGESAAELVHLGQAVLEHEGTIDWFVHTTFNVPTYSDAFKYAAFDGLGKVEEAAARRG